ncbi:nucleoside hydrolase [Escherichia coli]
MRQLIIADNVHGESGLESPGITRSRRSHRETLSGRADGENAGESAEPVTIVSTGPQTNVALLLNSHPGTA